MHSPYRALLLGGGVALLLGDGGALLLGHGLALLLLHRPAALLRRHTLALLLKCLRAVSVVFSPALLLVRLRTLFFIYWKQINKFSLHFLCSLQAMLFSS